MKKNNTYYILACLTLILAFIYARTLSKEVNIPTLQPLNNIPNEIKEFSGRSDSPSYNDFNYLSSDAKLLRVYTKKGENSPIAIFVGYWENQNGMKKIGPPRYTGKEWGYTWIKTKIIAKEKGNTLRMKEFLKEKGMTKVLFYYCYIIDGKVVPDEYQYRFLRMINSLLYKRNNAALVTVSVPITSDFPVEVAEPYIEDFLKEFLPIVKEYLPK